MRSEATCPMASVRMRRRRCQESLGVHVHVWWMAPAGVAAVAVYYHLKLVPINKLYLNLSNRMVFYGLSFEFQVNITGGVIVKVKGCKVCKELF